MENTILNYIEDLDGGIFLLQDMQNEYEDDSISSINEIFFSEIRCELSNNQLSFIFDEEDKYITNMDNICDVSEVFGELIITLEDLTRITITM